MSTSMRFRLVAKVARSGLLLVVLGFGLCIPSLAVGDIVGVINVKPVQVRDDSGLNPANVNLELYVAESNKILAQAGIIINFLPWSTLNSTTYNSLDNSTEVNNFFNLTGIGESPDPNTITLWFVRDHFSAYGQANRIGGPGINNANRAVVADSVFEFNGGIGRRCTITHEIGHLLGLRHQGTPPGGDLGVTTRHLMRSGDRLIPNSVADIFPDGDLRSQLTPAQIATASSDIKVIPIPEPGSIVLLTTGLGLLVISRRRMP